MAMMTNCQKRKAWTTLEVIKGSDAQHGKYYNDDGFFFYQRDGSKPRILEWPKARKIRLQRIKPTYPFLAKSLHMVIIFFENCISTS